MGMMGSLQEQLAELPAEQRNALIDKLPEEALRDLMYDWRGYRARANQLPPGTPGSSSDRKDWIYWNLQAGRGFGKTKTGAETIREWVDQGFMRFHLVGPTASDARDVMIQGHSGLLSCFPPARRPLYEPSKRLITFDTGAVAYTFSADEPERLRGPQCERGWCDEIAAWKYPEAWDNFVFGLRLGSDPKAVVTSTPKPVKLVRDLVKDPNTVVTYGSSYENRSNLAPAFFNAIIRKYEGTRLGRQELMGELLEDLPGALWTRALIEATRFQLVDVRWNLIVRIVVAIDPAVTANEDSDETGIVVAGLTPGGHAIVLDDLSCRETPLGWAKVAVAAFHSRRADRIIGEVNNGGDLVAGNIRAVAPNVPFRAVRASRGKALRAEPVAALYEQGRIHHVGTFEQLEDQMCAYVPGVTEKSPDRMDALVWAITELLVDPEPLIQDWQMGQPVQISPI